MHFYTVILIYGNTYGSWYQKWFPETTILYGISTSIIYQYAVSYGNSFIKIDSPSNIQAQKSSKNSIYVSWNEVNNVAGYKLYRSTNINGTFEHIATLTDNYYDDINLQTIKYYYKVRTYQYGYEDFSIDGVLSNAILCDLTPIKNIQNVTVNAIKERQYTGKAQTPDIIVKDGSTTLTRGVDYSVSYKNNINVGLATVTITGKNRYAGVKTANFKIILNKVKNLRTQKANKKQIKIVWDKDSQATGYEIYRYDSSSNKYKLIKTIVSNGTIDYTDKNLKNKVKYKYKVRAYKNSGNQKLYGEYSTILITSVKEKYNLCMKRYKKANEKEKKYLKKGLNAELSMFQAIYKARMVWEKEMNYVYKVAISHNSKTVKKKLEKEQKKWKKSYDKKLNKTNAAWSNSMNREVRVCEESLRLLKKRTSAIIKKYL